MLSPNMQIVYGVLAKKLTYFNQQIQLNADGEKNLHRHYGKVELCDEILRLISTLEDETPNKEEIHD